jgi:hypothetical protein
MCSKTPFHYGVDICECVRGAAAAVHEIMRNTKTAAAAGDVWVLFKSFLLRARPE